MLLTCSLSGALPSSRNISCVAHSSKRLLDGNSCWLYVQTSLMYKQLWLNPVTKEDAGCARHALRPFVMSQSCFFLSCRWTSSGGAHTRHRAHSSQSVAQPRLDFPPFNTPSCNCQLLQCQFTFLCVGSRNVTCVVFVSLFKQIESCFMLAQVHRGFGPVIYCMLTIVIYCFYGLFVDVASFWKYFESMFQLLVKLFRLGKKYQCGLFSCDDDNFLFVLITTVGSVISCPHAAVFG